MSLTRAILWAIVVLFVVLGSVYCYQGHWKLGIASALLGLVNLLLL